MMRRLFRQVGNFAALGFCIVLILGMLVGIPHRGAAPTTVVNVETESNITYARHDGRNLMLDIAYPRVARGCYPTLVYISGSGWKHSWSRSFDRHQFDTAIAIAAESGYVAATVAYRPTSVKVNGKTKYRYPDELLDVRSAVRWLRAHAARYHIDPNRIGAIGWSSAGHLSLLLGLTGPTVSLQGEADNLSFSSSVQAIVGIEGPSDLSRLYAETDSKEIRESLSDLFGGASTENPRPYLFAEPVTYLRGSARPKLLLGGHYLTRSAPPLLLVHGLADYDVPLNQSRILLDRIRAVGAKTPLTVIDHDLHSSYYLTPAIFGFLDRMLKV